MIKRLILENVKRIKFLDISPDKNLVKIKGKNAQGKTSVIDSIQMILLGKRAIGEKPILEGESSASAILETDLFKAERQFYKDKYGVTKSNLIVYDKTGKLINKPQGFLNELLGNAIVSPEIIIRKTPMERVEILKKTFGIDFSKLDEERGRLFQERTERRRSEKLLSGQLNAYRHLPEEIKKTRTTEEVLKDIAKAEIPFERERESHELQVKERNQLADLKHEKNTLWINFSNRQKRKDELDEKIKKLQEELIETEKDIESFRKRMEETKEIMESVENKISSGYRVSTVDIERMESLKGELKEISLVEKTVQEMALRNRVYKEREDERKKIQKLGREIETIDQTKKEILKKTKFPIEGMSFGESDILLNEIPFSECSAAEKIKIAVSICAETETEGKILKIEDGSLLDQESLKKIEEIAKCRGYQIWVEIVDQGNQSNCMVIEEGIINDQTS